MRFSDPEDIQTETSGKIVYDRLLTRLEKVDSIIEASVKSPENQSKLKKLVRENLEVIESLRTPKNLEQLLSWYDEFFDTDVPFLISYDNGKFAQEYMNDD